MVIDFINKKNHPLNNREFYEYFLSEHDKSEKIETYENTQNLVAEILKFGRG